MPARQSAAEGDGGEKGEKGARGGRLACMLYAVESNWYRNSEASADGTKDSIYYCYCTTGVCIQSAHTFGHFRSSLRIFVT